ncbi:hypothetical protein D3C76_1432050 [compost metagenome]
MKVKSINTAIEIIALILCLMSLVIVSYGFIEGNMLYIVMGVEMPFVILFCYNILTVLKKVKK